MATFRLTEKAKHTQNETSRRYLQLIHGVGPKRRAVTLSMECVIDFGVFKNAREMSMDCAGVFLRVHKVCVRPSNEVPQVGKSHCAGMSMEYAWVFLSVNKSVCAPARGASSGEEPLRWYGVGLSVFLLSVRLPVGPVSWVSLHLCLFLCLSVCLTCASPLDMPACLSCLFVCLSVCLPYQSVSECLSACLYA
jgi:hypothetical protein